MLYLWCLFYSSGLEDYFYKLSYDIGTYGYDTLLGQKYSFRTATKIAIISYKANPAIATLDSLFQCNFI